MDPQKEPQPNYLPYPPQTSASVDDEIDLRELFKAIWKGKWVIIVTTFVFAVSAVLYALTLPNIYKADAILAPAESSSSGTLSKMAGQFSGLAALTGVSFGGHEISQAEMAVQVMKSRKFVDGFISRHNLLVPLMAASDWDLSTNKLILDETIYDSKSRQWLRKAKGLRGAEPSAQEAYQVFINDILGISQDKETGLYKISVKYFSPYIAKNWVDWLIADINRTMRERAISEASKNLEYLNNQLQKTAIADMQSTFYKLIEEQTKSLMLAEVQEEFVFKVIDPPVFEEVKEGPRRFLIVVISLIAGLIFSVIILVFKAMLNSMRGYKSED